MSARLNLGNLRNESSMIPADLNLCPTDNRIAYLANAFQERAFSLGRFWGSTQLMRLCVSNGCIILPREVAVIEAANLNGIPMTMGNQWYQFIRPHSDCSSGRFVSAPCNSDTVRICGCCNCRDMVMEDRGTVASFSTTTGTTQKIRIYPGNAIDVGKTIIIQGKDSNGNWVRSGPTSARIDGELVTLAMPFVDTATTWGPGAPMRVIKEPTQYRVLMYAVEGADEYAIADYQPSETEPQYRMVSIPGFNSSSCGCSSSGTRTLLAVVSLQHIPVVADEDWLLFQNITAYRIGMKAEQHYRNGDTVSGDSLFYGNDRAPRNGRGVLRKTYGAGALPLLEAELRKMTGDQTVANISFSSVNLAGFR